MSQACSGGAKRDTDLRNPDRGVVEARIFRIGTAEFREGQRRLFELAAQELDAAKPEQGVGFTRMARIESTKLGKGGLRRLEVILHGPLEREIILLFG